jgi:ribosomal protein L7/L12
MDEQPQIIRMIAQMYDDGLQILDAIKQVRKKETGNLVEAKRLVHSNPKWQQVVKKHRIPSGVIDEIADKLGTHFVPPKASDET